jgi:hypothetical protein
MNANVLEAGRIEPTVTRDPVRGRPDEDFRPFAGVVAGVAAGSLVWLGVAWILRSLV